VTASCPGGDSGAITGSDVLVGWAQSLSGRAGMRRRGCLRFVFYGRVSTEDWQDPAVDAGSGRPGRLARRGPRADHARTRPVVQAGDHQDQDPGPHRHGHPDPGAGPLPRGRPPYGYRLADAGPHPNKAHAAWGRRAHKLEPDPATAPVVRWMFSQWLALGALHRGCVSYGTICHGGRGAGCGCPDGHEYAGVTSRRGRASIRPRGIGAVGITPRCPLRGKLFGEIRCLFSEPIAGFLIRHWQPHLEAAALHGVDDAHLPLVRLDDAAHDRQSQARTAVRAALAGAAPGRVEHAR